MEKKFISILSLTLIFFMLFVNITFAKDIERYASGGPTHSHEVFCAQAIDILINDYGVEKIKPILRGEATIVSSTDLPDEDENDYCFTYHFFNPYTNKNYWPISSNIQSTTALTKFNEHLNNAVKSYSTNKEYALKELGRAIHYFEDINEPHHAANLTAANSTHAFYEKYVDNRNDDFLVYHSTKYNDYKDMNFHDYYNTVFINSAKFAYSYKDVVNNPLMYFSDNGWHKAAQVTLDNLQENLAAIILRFYKEVGEINLSPTSNSILLSYKFRYILVTLININISTV